jgi:hypothetical protein
VFPVVAKPVVRPIYRVRGRLTGRAAPISGHKPPLPPNIHHLPYVAGPLRDIGARFGDWTQQVSPTETRNSFTRLGLSQSPGPGASVLGILPPLRAIALRAALIHRVSVFEAGRMPGRYPTSTPQPRSSFNARRWKSGSPMACWAMSHAPSAPSLPCEILARPSIPFDQLP